MYEEIIRGGGKTVPSSLNICLEARARICVKGWGGGGSDASTSRSTPLSLNILFKYDITVILLLVVSFKVRLHEGFEREVMLEYILALQYFEFVMLHTCYSLSFMLVLLVASFLCMTGW